HMSTCSFRFFFSDPAPTGIYPLSLHDALPIFGEGVTYFCHCTYPVIGHAIHNDGGAVNAVTFITDLFVIHAFQSAGAALDGTRDIVLGHVGIGSFVHSHAQARVGVGVTAAHACGYGDFLDKTSPDFAALFVLTTFTVLDIGPFAVSCHTEFLPDEFVDDKNGR